MHATRFPALASHDKVGQVSASAALIKPQLAAAIVLRPTHEAVPVQVVHVTPRTSAHEAGGHDWPAFELSSLVQGLAMD